MSWFSNAWSCCKCGFGARPPTEKHKAWRQLAHNLNNMVGWLLMWGLIALFWAIVLALHAGLHPIVISWWIPMIGMLTAMAMLEKFRMTDIRGPVLAALIVVTSLCVVLYISICHWETAVLLDRFGKAFREIPLKEITKQDAWWYHLVPVWCVAGLGALYMYTMRSALRTVGVFPKWVVIDRHT